MGAERDYTTGPMIRQVRCDGGVRVNSPERRAGTQSRASSLLRAAQQTGEATQDIHATLEAMEAAVGVSAQGASARRAQRGYMSQQVERRSKEIVETQEFLAEMRARIEELSEIQEQANTIRRIAAEQTAHNPATSPSADMPSGAADESELLEQELAPLQPLFEAAGVARQHRNNILNIFRVASAGADRLSLDAFTDVMVWLHVPREYCRQYFKAFDLDQDGTVDYREFLLGLIAMDSTTEHEGMWAEMRARYIFRTYDVNENRRLDLAELTHLVRHLRRGRGDSTRPHEIEAEAFSVMDALCSDTEDEVSFDAFLGALPPFGDVVSGTTVLFRLGTQTSPKLVDISSAFTDDYDEASSDWTDNESNNGGTAGMHPTQLGAEHPGSSSRGRSVSSTQPASARSDEAVQNALHEERVRRDDLRLALRFCQSMPDAERKAFLREFFQVFQTDGGTDDDEGDTEGEDASEEYEFGPHENVFRDGAESALDLENYNWVADPGPHPGVRGLGSDTVPGASEYPTGAPRRANDTQESSSLSDHTERVDSVLEQFEDVMDSDPSTVEFLNVLVSELKAVRGLAQQNQVLAAVRNTLVQDPDDSRMGVSTGMGIAAELLGTQQGDRLPSRRGRRAKLSAMVAETDLRPDLRPGSAPSGQTTGLRGTDPTARPTSAEGHRSFINSSFPPLDTADDVHQASMPNLGTSGNAPSHLAASDHDDVQLGSHSGAYDYVETADSASSVSTSSSYREDRGSVDPTMDDTSYLEAIKACTDGRHLGSEFPGIYSADDSSADQSGYSYSSSESDPGSGSTTQMNVLTQEYSAEIRQNEAVGCELSNVLTTLIEAGKSLNEAAAQGEESVTLTVQHLEMVAQRILAVAEGQHRFDARLRETIVAVHLKFAEMDATAYKDTLVQEVSDILYDEMIFNKVLQQVEHSYDEDIEALHQHMRPGEDISDELRGELQLLLEQRHNDLHRLHQEREKRLAAKQHPSPGIAVARASHQRPDSESQQTTATMSTLSEMEPDTTDTSENYGQDESSCNDSDDDNPPIELFARQCDTAADAESNDSEDLGSWSAESDPDGPSQPGDMRTHDPVTIDDLPTESLLDRDFQKAATGAKVDHGKDAQDAGLPSSAVDLVVKIDSSRKQELLKMMEEEQREAFPADGLPEAGNNDLDLMPDGSSPARDAMSTADDDASPDGPEEVPGPAASHSRSQPPAAAAGDGQDETSDGDQDGALENPLQHKRWNPAELHAEESVSKKMLVGWLKENCSTQLLKEYGLTGVVRNVVKKRNRAELVAAYKAHVDSTDGGED